MIKYENGYAYIDGYKFKKDKKTGYYLSGVINGKRYRLHRYIYEKYNGPIPKGHDIHHIDHNKDNNEIENLQLLTRYNHKGLHGKEVSEEKRQKYRDNMNNNVRPKAIEWHKSAEGREWHKEQYKNTLGTRNKIKVICQNCGKEFEVLNNGTNKFCSNNCKSAYRRKLGIDNITRKCKVCNTEFTTNKYSKRILCSECWHSHKR